MRVRSTCFQASGRRGTLTCAIASALLLGPGLACVVAGAGGPAGAAIFAGTAVAATLGYRQLTGGCVATCSKDWHCDHGSGLCKPDAREEPQRLVRPAGGARARSAGDARARSAVDAGAPPVDAGN